MAEGVDYFGPMKKSHKIFCLYTLGKLTKEWLVGSRIL